jgi:hypothetical protein
VRFLTALSGVAALIALLPAACSTSEEGLQPECSGGERAEVRCFEPGSTNFKSVGKGSPNPNPPAAQFDDDNCQVLPQVGDGCCMPALTGPELIDGKCCYGFCTGWCC